MEHQGALDSALEENAEQIKEIIARALVETPNAEERYKTLVESGFALAFASGQPNQESSDICLSALAKAVAGVDEVLLEAQNSALLLLRNSMSDTVTQEVKRRKKRIEAHLGMMYGTHAAMLLLQMRTLSDEEAFDVGFASTCAARSNFYGFIMFSEDTGMRCRCPEHVSARWRGEDVEEREAESKMLARFGTRHAALVAFGKWLSPVLTSLIKRELGGESTTESGPGHGTLDQRQVAEQTQGLLTRLLGGKEAGDAAAP